MDPELKEKLRKFRFRKETDNAAIISECCGQGRQHNSYVLCQRLRDLRFIPLHKPMLRSVLGGGGSDCPLPTKEAEREEGGI